uniref:Uncharacterized protein n=1 Tax=Anguilla anguilla TaxID=7936 RepID=A0A0E9RAL0_ANGAN
MTSQALRYLYHGNRAGVWPELLLLLLFL